MPRSWGSLGMLEESLRRTNVGVDIVCGIFFLDLEIWCVKNVPVLFLFSGARGRTTNSGIAEG